MKRFVYTNTLLTGVTLFILCCNSSSINTKVEPKVTDSKVDTVTLSNDNFQVNGKRSGVFFYYHDSLAQTHGVSMDAIKTKFALTSPVLLLESTEKQTPFFIHPGEKINVRNAGTDSLQMYIPGNVMRTNELDFFRRVVTQTGNMWYFVPKMSYQRSVGSMNQLTKLEFSIDSLKQERLTFLNSYSHSHPISEKFAVFAKHCISSTAIRDSLLLYHNNRSLLMKEKSYKSFIEAKAFSIQKLGFLNYATFYRLCIDLVSMAVGTNRFDIDGIGKSEPDFLKSFDFIENNFKGRTRDFLLAHLLKRAKTNHVDIPKGYIDKFSVLCQDKGYFNQVTALLQENKVAAAFKKGTNKLLSLDGKSVQDLNDVFATHRGKLIILDFWASWCIPCRDEMPYIADLKKVYKGKSIIFISISTDSEVGGWKKAAKEEALDEKENYLLLNADDASFIKHYNVNSIPRYMLIGKVGRVLNDNAPRPSEAKFRELINKNL
ncbi:TlpA family protein disulfide reductase [Pedobacter sp. JCM 36344]|uniref:TlpA family protein disulfide reductase n=1 Tax=Pedobacter sp. JCM 36344 TaxID=3374280 RepID=UPI003979D1EF